MLHYLNKPYPFISSSFAAKLYKAIATGLFVMLFLWLFDNKKQNNIFQFIDNGVIVFISQLFFLITFRRLFVTASAKARIKFWQYITGLIFATVLGFAFMYLYVTPVYFKTGYSFPAFINYIKENLPFLFPVILFILAMDYIVVLRTRKPGETVQTMQESKTETFVCCDSPLKEFILANESGLTVFKADKANILFIKSADNYIEIYYQSEGRVDKEMIRYQLSIVEADKENNFLCRAHRSYLCNLEKVSHVSGGMQNCTLHFKNTTVSVPVARSRARDIIQTVNAKSK